MADSATRIPTPSDIGLARRRLASHIRETPILESRAVSADAGVRIRFKCEMFQRGGSHKIRGAMNWALETSETESVDGVVTATSGNHGVAMAIATATIGVPLAAVMPETSSRIKREAAASYGAEVITGGVDGRNREAIADAIAQQRGWHRNTADTPAGIAGIGTLGLELADAAEIDGADVVVVPLGLGALLAGVAIALRARHPGIRIIGVEPEDGDDVGRSLRAGEIRTLDHVPNTIADGARALAPSALTFTIIRSYVDDVVSVSDRRIVEALELIWTRLKVVAEPTAALSFAAVLDGSVAGRPICVLSGGNVDPSEPLHGAPEATKWRR